MHGCRASRYPQTIDYRSDVAPKLARPEVDPDKVMVSAHDSAQNEDTCSACSGQRDGADYLGHADEEGGVPGFVQTMAAWIRKRGE